MKHRCSVYLFLLFSLITHNAWGQTPDSTKQAVDSTASVVSDRINDPDERERGPSLSKIMKKADESFGKKNYYAAMKYYSFVLKPEPLNVEALKGYGESAFAIAALDSAESAFQRMVDRGLSTGPDYFPKMRLAEVKFRKGNYAEALDLFSEIALNPQTPPVTEEVKKEAKARKRDCEWALQNLSLDIIQEGSYTILDTTYVNSVDFAEYVAFQEGDQLYFSAYRFDLKKDRGNPKRNSIKVLTATSTNGKMGAAEQMTVTESEINDLKRQHTAHTTISKSGNAIYYALGDYVKDSADIRFDLYRRKKQSDGKWGLPEKLDIVNATGFTNTEPSIGTLPGQSNETLFFVSDRPGGAGKRDIWYSHIVDDSLSSPLPLADINTKGDDVTPFYHAASSNLYFSTDGKDTLLRTIGGFDIYRSKYVSGGKWAKPRHLGTPINSPANDVFFVLDSKSEKAYFSNNLRGSSNDSEEGCCYDIYAVEFLRPKLRAIGFHKLTKEILPFTRISLYETGANGQLILIANPPPDTSSSYAFDVTLNKNYVLIADKNGFSSDTLRFTTPDEVWSGEIVKKLYLRPFINLIATVYDCETNLPILGATAKFFDLGFRDTTGNFINSNDGGKTDILAASTNRQDYKIDFEHQYVVIMEKEGYIEPDTSKVVSTIGRVTGGTIEVKLYLQRPDPLTDYLPIPLYFDNDFPNPRTISDTTFLDYQKTFVAYMQKKEPEFIPGYIKGLKGAKRTADSLLIDDFFELKVRANWVKFFEFSDSLNAILDRGDSIELTLKGYASPLANSEYNLHLTNRRIASVYNHFQIFDGGVFKRYYKTDNSGSLKIFRQPNGDSKAPAGISDNGKDRRNSVYDVAPSLERRVEIVGVRVRKEVKGNCD